MTDYVRRLGRGSGFDGRELGNKGANLARLIDLGMNVPAGFCITRGAYGEFVSGNGLADLLALRALDGLSEPLRAERCRRAQAAIRAGNIPTHVVAAIVAAYRELVGAGDSPGVAVRSSSTVEDLGSASFAGVFETYLNVVGTAPLCEKVKACWASLWSPAAISWMKTAPAGEYAMPVVVQRMVRAEAAGVMFTLHPVSGDSRRTLINAAFGLGEGVVDGTVPSDTVVVDVVNRRIEERVAAKKNRRIVAAAYGGTCEEEAESGLSETPVLTDEQALALADIGLTLQDRFGGPQDIEWAWADNRFHLLQTRPIAGRTSAFPLPDAVSAAPEITEWELEFSEPFSNFGCSLEAKKNPIYRGAVSRLTGQRVVNTQAVFNGYIYHQELTQGPRGLPKPLFKGVQLLRWLRLAPSADRIFYDEAVPAIASALSETRTRLERTSDLAGRAGLLQEMVAAYLAFEAAAVPVGLLANSFCTIATRLCAWLLHEPEVAATALFLGLPNKTVARDRELAALREFVHARNLSSKLGAGFPGASPDEPEASAELMDFRARLASFQRDYGYIWASGSTKDPGWTTNHDLARVYLCERRTGPAVEAPEAVAERYQSRLDAKCRSSWLRRMIPIEWRLLQSVVRLARRYYPCREDYNHYLSSAAMVIGEVMRAIGRDLAHRRLIADPERVFCLSYDEVIMLPRQLEAGEATPLADLERRYREQQCGRVLQPPAAVTLGKTAVRSKAPEVGLAGRTLRGTPGSAGVAEGRARVVRRAELARVQAGEILVCDTIRPEWSPLLLFIGGLVTDRGYVLSHGANLARESGLPAVLGTGVATQVVKDGDWLRIDGSAGTVAITREGSS